jgi:NADPH:quinone reductase-like Zn-dependent oxidoreductase
MLPSEKLLILGTGGVGLYALQLAKIAGALVIASGGKSSSEVSKELGADFVLNYREENVIERVMEITNREGVDLIYDCVGGETLARSIQAIKKGPYVGSRLVTIAAGPLEINFGYEIHCLYVKENRRDLSLIADLVERGLLKPVIDSVFSFRDIPRAQEKLEKGGIRGKVVVSMEKD